ncbi:hypothetical protein ACIQ6Y_06590 [Streptomyces sp. NPDC096205]|uniref:hypothetical protein n=1 Tax=Streptomyces sp. NPDC096205 TaxID=3366081 RepID=UPI003819FFC4
MTFRRETADASGPARPAGTGRAVAVLVLVALGALVPLLGPSAALHGTGEAAAPGVGGVGLLRTVLFAALCVPLGELFVNRLARGVTGASAERPCSRAAFAAGAGFVAALGPASVVATGNLVPSGWAQIDVGGLYASRDGKLALLEVNAFAVAWLCALSRRPGSQVWPLTLLAKVLLVAAVAALALWARVRLRRAADALTACVPARGEVALLGVVVAASGLLTALPVPIRW